MPLQVKEHQGLLPIPRAKRKARNRFSSNAFRESTALLTTSFPTSSFHKYKKINLSWYKSPSCGTLLQQPYEANGGTHICPLDKSLHKGHLAETSETPIHEPLGSFLNHSGFQELGEIK